MDKKLDYLMEEFANFLANNYERRVDAWVRVEDDAILWDESNNRPLNDFKKARPELFKDFESEMINQARCRYCTLD